MQEEPVRGVFQDTGGGKAPQTASYLGTECTKREKLAGPDEEGRSFKWSALIRCAFYKTHSGSRMEARDRKETGRTETRR